MIRFENLMALFALLLVSVMPAPCVAQYGLAEDLPVRTYRSPSGHYSLGVDPSARSGAGKARYGLYKDGKQVWSSEIAFTFWQAAVTDDGIAAGYAYSSGINEDDGEFIVAILAPDGETRMLDRSPRKGSRFLHTLGDPKANGLFLDANNDRLVVRVDDADLNESSESWWTWRISDGESTGKFKPLDLMTDATTMRHVFDARPVAGTPLTLIHWFRSGCSQQGCDNQNGARFSLVDAAYKPVWVLDLPADYTNSTDEAAERRIYDEMLERGAILNTSQIGRFEIRQVATRQRRSFVVGHDDSHPSQWKVRELTALPYVEKYTPTASQGQPAPVNLRKLGSIDLGNEETPETSPIRDIHEFAVGEGDRFAFTRGCNCNQTEVHALIVVDGNGQIAHEIKLQTLPKELHFTDQLSWISADRWLVTTSEMGEHQRSSADWIDASNGEVRHVGNLVDAQIDALSASPDGSFVALISRDRKYNTAHGLAAFDAEGKLRWEVGDSTSDDALLFSPQDVTLVSSGDIVVLENISKKLKIYSQTGKWLRTVDLEEAWGREPNYPSGIMADLGGGVIIHDFHSVPAVVRMALDGNVISTLTPAFANGADFQLSGGVQSAPDGRLWTSDGSALLRLDATGKVDRIVGRKPEVENLEAIAALTVSGDGKIHAVDRRTGAVHVFDAQGQRLRVLEPAIGDYSDTLFDPSLTVTAGGDVYVSRKDGGPGDIDFIHYSADGKRVGIVELSLAGEVKQEWHVQPDGSMRWVVGYENVYRVDSKGSVLDTLDRSADGQWLARPSLASVGAGGSIAIISGGEPARPFGSAAASPVLASLFSADGKILESWAAPQDLSFQSGTMAYDGNRLAFLVGKGGFEDPTAVVVTDAHGAPILRFTPAADHLPRRVFLVSADSVTELWLFDGKSQIDRYALPADATENSE